MGETRYVFTQDLLPCLTRGVMEKNCQLNTRVS